MTLLARYARAIEQSLVQAIFQQFPGATMVDPSEKEIIALKKAGEAAGEYLETLPAQGFCDLSYEQYMTMIEAAVTSYLEALPNDEVPF